MDRGGRRCGEEGKDGVLIGIGKGWVRSRTRRPQDFGAIVFVSSKIDCGTIRRTTTREHCRLCRPIHLRIKFHGNKLARIVFVAHVIIFDRAVGPRVFHIPIDSPPVSADNDDAHRLTASTATRLWEETVGGGGGVDHNVEVPEIFGVDLALAAKAARSRWRFEVDAGHHLCNKVYQLTFPAEATQQRGRFDLISGNAGQCLWKIDGIREGESTRRNSAAIHKRMK